MSNKDIHQLYSSIVGWFVVHLEVDWDVLIRIYTPQRYASSMKFVFSFSEEQDKIVSCPIEAMISVLIFLSKNSASAHVSDSYG